LCTNIKARPSAESGDMINSKQFTELLASSEGLQRSLKRGARGRGLPSQHPARKPENQTVFIQRSQVLEQI
jgi:hypothetical protein